MDWSRLEYPEKTLASLQRNWEYSQACYPGQQLWFLQSEYVRQCAERAGFPADGTDELLRQAALIRDNEGDSRLVWHLHWHSRIAHQSLRASQWPWPADLAKKPHAGLTFLTVFPLFALTPSMDAWMQARALPRELPDAALRDVRNWSLHHYRQTGRWGDAQTLWSHHLLHCDIFQLGRLQFQFGQFTGRTPLVLRHTATGEIILLSQENLPVAADGRYACPDEPVCFTTTLAQTDREYSGNPVRDGLVSQEQLSLPCQEWEPVFRPGDPMLNIHIPEDGPLDYQTCQASLDCARRFYSAQFPEFDFRGFQTQTWLLGTALRDCLPADSNILRFQSLFLLMPAIQGNDWQLRERVFGDPDLPLEKVPRKTTLQRAVYAKLAAGARLRNGAGVIPR
ncbi:MAG: hypothetical protein IJJ33_08945 [Victivallales bacterium]|nr:hypothetical protein [Victivallales bacterium]